MRRGRSGWTLAERSSASGILVPVDDVTQPMGGAEQARPVVWVMALLGERPRPFAPGRLPHRLPRRPTRRTPTRCRGRTSCSTGHPAVRAHVFVDESKRHGLLVAAVIVQPRDLAPASTVLRQLCLPSQTRLHFTKERDARRGRSWAPSSASESSSTCTTPLPSAASSRPAPPACAPWCRTSPRLTPGGSCSSRTTRSSAAIRLSATPPVRDASAGDRLTYEHLPARSEPLLADAAAWCWSRGGGWPGRLQPIIGRIRTLT